MFSDLSEYEQGSVIETDICIIGAGPAGITLARALSSTGRRIALLESGGFELEQDTQSLCRGTVESLDYDALESTRLRLFGGTSGHWGGQSCVLEPSDFERFSWVPDSGWPISYAEYERHVPAAAEICGLGTESFSWEYWSQREGAPQFPFDRERLNPLVFRYPRPVIRFGEAYRSEIAADRAIQCILHANLTRLEPGGDNDRVRTAHVATLEGRRAEVRSTAFVLACGGMENSRLLLLSQQQTGHPFGNDQDAVGRYFMEHPNYNTSRIVVPRSETTQYLRDPRRTLDDREVRLDFQFAPTARRELGILNHSMFLIRRAQGEPELPIRSLVNVLPGAGSEPGEPKIKSLRIRVEHAPRASSRVLLNDDDLDPFGLPRMAVRLELGELEDRTIAALQDALAIELGRSHSGRMNVSLPEDPAQWRSAVGWQYHHLGGTRMHADRRASVVDANCRVHGLENLYVAGSSVFPTGGHVNPTLSLVALSLRLAEHVRNRVL